MRAHVEAVEAPRECFRRLLSVAQGSWGPLCCFSAGDCREDSRGNTYTPKLASAVYNRMSVCLLLSLAAPSVGHAERDQRELHTAIWGSVVGSGGWGGYRSGMLASALVVAYLSTAVDGSGCIVGKRSSVCSSSWCDDNDLPSTGAHRDMYVHYSLLH